MRYLILSLLLPVFASEAAVSVWEIEGKKVDLVLLENRHLLISKSCLTKEGALSCDAVKASRKASHSKSAPGIGGDSANPGALICRTVGGEVVLGFDERRNEQSFCRFADSSLIDSGSLHYHGLQNDRKRVE